MSRQARLRSETGIYHVMVRGNNKAIIFLSREDYLRFIKIVHEVKKICGFDLYAYCLMDNHAHLLLKESTTMNISDIMKRINIRYAMWHNYKYRQLGHFFQGRFKSEPVEDDACYANVLRYIHQNPLKAGICEDIINYEWSSYQKYKQNYEGYESSLDNSLNLGYWGEWTAFESFHEMISRDSFLDIDNRQTYSDQTLKSIIFRDYDLETALSTSKKTRDQVLASIVKDTQVSYTQLARVSGLSINMISRAARRFISK